MSERNVEVLRTAYEFAEARGVEGLLELASEDIVWISDPRFPGGGRHRGKENVRRWLTKLWIYDEVSIDVEEISDLNDRALGITRFHAVAPDAPPGGLAVVPPGLVQGWTDQPGQSFLDRASALEATGMRGWRSSTGTASREDRERAGGTPSSRLKQE